jgi:hypothetical protein
LKATTTKVMCSDGRVRTATYRDYGPLDRAFVRVTVNGIQRTVTGRVLRSCTTYNEFVPDAGLVNEGAIK